MTGGLDVQEFLAGYFAEMEEHIGSASRNLLAVEEALRRKESSPRSVRELFRSLHTIKGISSMVGVEPIVDLAHAMETVLRSADKSGGGLPEAAVALVLQGIQGIAERVQDLAKKKTVRPAPPTLIEALTNVQWPTSGQAPVAGVRIDLPPDLLAKLGANESAQLTQGAMSGKRVLRLEFVPSAARAEQGINITTVRQRLSALADIVKVMPQSRPADSGAPAGLAFVLLIVTQADNETLASAASVAPDAIVSAVATAAPADVASIPPGGLDAGGLADEDALPIQTGFVRVRVDRLDDALEKLSALVVNRFRLTRAVATLAAQGANITELKQIVAENGRQIRDLRAAIMRARMVTVSELLERIPLLVRGMSQSTGKQIQLQIDAGHAEVDKGVGERLFPAILHLIRNAVDHAIEPAADRKRVGKPEAGRIVVTCFERSSTQLELSISDDGRGIDAAQVAERAEVRVPESDAELLDILTRPGFSTLHEATRTSGRGIGMDIVKRVAVDELGGELELKTAVGQGTTITLRVPLTITIVDAFSFIAGDQTFVVPVSMVEEILEIDPAQVHTGPSGNSRQPVRLFPRRGEAVPLLSLDKLFDLPPTKTARPKALVVRRRGSPMAFEVDRVLGQQEVVIRPLTDALVKAGGITGSTDLGDGRPVLVVDLLSLGGQVGRQVPS